MRADAAAAANPPVLLLSTADTDLLAARASGGPWRLANPARTEPGGPAGLLDGAFCVVRAAARRPAQPGRRAWRRCWRAACRRCVLGGEPAPDAELMALSTVPAGRGRRRPSPTCARAGRATCASSPASCPTPSCSPARVSSRPGRSRPTASTSSARRTPDRPTVGDRLLPRARAVREHRASSTRSRDAVEAAGANALPVFCGSLRGPASRRGCSALLAGVDALVVTVLAAGGTVAADASARRGRKTPGTSAALAALDVPVLQAPVPDHLARAVGGLQRGAHPDGRGDAGGDPGVRRPADHACRSRSRKTGAGRAVPSTSPTRSGPPGWPGSPCAHARLRHTPRRATRRRDHAVVLPHQARPGRQRGRPGHPGVRRASLLRGAARRRLRPRRTGFPRRTATR